MSADRFARLAALRPGRKRAEARHGGRTPVVATQEGNALAALLGADVARNRYGEHLVVRRWFAQPGEISLPADVLRALVPDAPDETADPGQWLFLDTETTGLSGGTGTYAFLVGVAWLDAGGLQVEQYFMRDHTEECSLLAALAERLAERRVLVTFNGKAFDWPLLETRFRMTRTLAPRQPLAHLDLLHPARQLWRLRLGSVRLTELERGVMGLDRGEDIPPHRIPNVYFDFLRGGHPAPLVAVFHHNRMDLVGLAAQARRIFSLLTEPAEAGDPLELYGLSRFWFRRDAQRARLLYERALDAGLPRTLDRAARRELARLAKRQRDYARANALWAELLPDRRMKTPGLRTALSGAMPRSSMVSAKARHALFFRGRPAFLEDDLGAALEAFEQLAIHYEHRARQPERAAELTGQALRTLEQALRAGQVPLPRYRRLHSRLAHRLSRLEQRLPQATQASLEPSKWDLALAAEKRSSRSRASIK